jgi:competence protein ComEC
MEWKKYVLAGLLLANILVWASLYRQKPGNLKVYFLDVGQGDAIFIETPNKYQVLIDGGRNKKVISELGKIMSFGDRSIDVVIATHPDADHIGGLPEVAERYSVGLFLEPGVDAEKALNDELHGRIANKNIQTLLAKRGQVINFGDGVTLTILFPNADVSNWDTNDASIVAKLTYGEEDFLLTGDAGIKTENILMSLSLELIDVEVLKAGHHGSRTSTSLMFAEAVTPEYAIISAGRDNTYGHPHKEVLNILSRVDSQVLSTAESGTIKFETDGKNLYFK